MLTEKIVATGTTAIAVDAGPDMAAAARARGIDARVMDGQKLTFTREFDAVFSNAALHWMRDQEAVPAGMHRAPRPGGRFVAEMGGHNNTAAIIVATERPSCAPRAPRRLNPWYFRSAEAYRKSSNRRSSRSRKSRSSCGPTALPTGIEAWLDTFAEDFSLRSRHRTDRDPRRITPRS